MFAFKGAGELELEREYDLEKEGNGREESLQRQERGREDRTLGMPACERLTG